MKFILNLTLALILVSPTAFASSSGITTEKKEVAANLVVEMLKIRLINNCNEKVDRAGRKYVATKAECRLEILSQLEANNNTRQYNEYVIFLQIFANSNDISLNS